MLQGTTVNNHYQTGREGLFGLVVDDIISLE